MRVFQQTVDGPFTILANDGDAGHFTVVNKGPNVGVTTSTGTATLTSPQVTVTPTGILNGSTTYDYKVVLRGYNGELSAASAVGETLAGAATLGINTATMMLCSRSRGTATCTTSAAHNFQPGAMVDVEGSSNIAYNGAHKVVATPSGTTFDTSFNTPQPLGTITLRRPASGQWLATITGINTSGCTAGQPLQLEIMRAKDSAAGAANIRAHSITYRTNNTQE